MDLGIEGKIAVVTGSTAGIGFAIANTLAAEGAQVIVNGRTQARVDAALWFPGPIKQLLTGWRADFPGVTIDDKPVFVLTSSRRPAVSFGSSGVCPGSSGAKNSSGARRPFISAISRAERLHHESP